MNLIEKKYANIITEKESRKQNSKSALCIIGKTKTYNR